ncbi:MAG: hypothetical protein V1912_10695 [bacterium]
MKAKKPILVLALTLTLLALALVLPGAASAKVDTPDRHYAVSGEWSWWGEPDSLVVDKVIGGNTFFHGHEHGWFTVTFASTEPTFEPYVGKVSKDGSMWAIITISFTGTVGGVPGTAVIRLTVNAVPGETMGGRWVIVSGSGGLRHLHGMGTWLDKTPADL